MHFRSFRSRLIVVVVATRLLSGDFALKTTAATADHATQELQRLTGLQVSFLRQGAADDTALYGSSLGAVDRGALGRGLPAARQAGLIELGGEAHVLRTAAVSPGVLVALPRPLAEALRSHDRLLAGLRSVAVAGMLLSLLGAVMVARRVSRPVLALAAAAPGVAAGDFTSRLSLRQRDELERVGRLKRFLSPQLAEALSAGDGAVLASHRREITVVFCDLRGFANALTVFDVRRLRPPRPEASRTVRPAVAGEAG
jgi:methyl-accepting chemotaxis protein